MHNNTALAKLKCRSNQLIHCFLRRAQQRFLQGFTEHEAIQRHEKMHMYPHPCRQKTAGQTKSAGKSFSSTGVREQAAGRDGRDEAAGGGGDTDKEKERNSTDARIMTHVDEKEESASVTSKEKE